MSIVTGSSGLMVQLNDGSTSGHPFGSTPQAEQVVTITGPGALPVVMTTGPIVACGWKTLTWNGMQFLHAIDHGQGLQFAYVFYEVGGPVTWFPSVTNGPTEQGSQADGAGTNVCTSNNIYRGKVGANRLIRITNPAQWLPAGRLVPPIARNTTALSDYYTTMDHEIGLPGHDQIIKVHNYMTVANGPQTAALAAIQKWTLNCPASLFLRIAEFNTFHRCDPDSGALTLVDPGTGPGLGHTHPWIISTPDGNYAASVYMAEADQGADGFHQCHMSDGIMTGTFCQSGDYYPTGMVPGDVYLYKCYIVVGTRASVVADIQYLRTTFG